MRREVGDRCGEEAEGEEKSIGLSGSAGAEDGRENTRKTRRDGTGPIGRCLPADSRKRQHWS